MQLRTPVNQSKAIAARPVARLEYSGSPFQRPPGVWGVDLPEYQRRLPGRSKQFKRRSRRP